MQAEKIIGIKKIGTLPTVDIEVKSDRHIFYGNGIATSNSHSIEYGLVSYWTAFAKAHGSHAFYTAWLKESIGQQDGEKDVIKLTANAMTQKVKINTPTILTNKDNFYTDGKEIWFGLINIKGVGASVVRKLHEASKKAEEEIGVSLKDMSWIQFLVYVSGSINSKAMLAMIMAGALDHLKMSRTQMKYEYEKFLVINDNELGLIKSKATNYNMALVEFLRPFCKTRKNGGVVANERRLGTFEDIIKTLDKPPFDLADSPNKILENERRLLGVALTYNVGDSIANDAVNCSCYEFAEGKPLDSFVLGVEILDVRPYNIKRGKQTGKQMYYLDVSDGTTNMPNCTVFPDTFDEYGSLITKGNRVLLFGKRDSKFNSFNVQKVIQA